MERDHGYNTGNVIADDKYLVKVDTFGIDGIQGRHIVEYVDEIVIDANMDKAPVPTRLDLDATTLLKMLKTLPMMMKALVVMLKPLWMMEKPLIG